MATPLSPRTKQVDPLSGRELDLPARDFRPGALVKAQQAPSDQTLNPITGLPKTHVASPRSDFGRKSVAKVEASPDLNNYHILSGQSSDEHSHATFTKREVAPAPVITDEGPVAGRAIAKSPTRGANGSKIISSHGAFTREATRPVNPITGQPLSPTAKRSTSHGAFTIEAKENGSSVNPITGEKIQPTSPRRSMGTIQHEVRAQGASMNPLTGEVVDRRPIRVRSTKKVDKDDGHL